MHTSAATHNNNNRGDLPHNKNNVVIIVVKESMHSEGINKTRPSPLCLPRTRRKELHQEQEQEQKKNGQFVLANYQHPRADNNARRTYHSSLSAKLEIKRLLSSFVQFHCVDRGVDAPSWH